MSKSTVKPTQIDITELKSYKKAWNFEQSIMEEKMKLGSELVIQNVPIILRGVQTFIHTYACGDPENKETLVLLHGYAGGALNFFSMLSTLSKQFRVYAIDFIGMGLSDRQQFKVDHNPKAVVEFFVESVIAWLDALGIKKFKVAGHSFGGYISTMLAINQPERVEKVFLLSPMASTKVDPEQDLSKEENLNAFIKKQPFFRSLLFRFVRCQIKSKPTPAMLLKKWFVPGDYFIGKAIKMRLKITDEKEAKKWKGFLKNIMKLPESTDHHIHDLVTLPGAQAKFSLEEALTEQEEKLKMPFTIYFGDEDWMNSKGCKNLIENKIINGQIVVIEKAGHQLPFDQPLVIAEKIVAESIAEKIVAESVA